MSSSVQANVSAVATQIFREIQGAFGILRLKDLIKSVRASKTAAEERAVIAKESAFIRTQIKEENVDNRANNVAKLLYIHMLGYPAHFGQLECLKLVSQPRFADKRLGYLGIMMLLDENAETLTLVTNCLKNDMNHPNMYIVALALATFANIASPEMSRDLATDLEKMLSSGNSYIRKKAVLAVVRIIRKAPELVDNFFEKARVLINEKNHGVILTGVTLLLEMCKLDHTGQIALQCRQLVPALVRHLKNLITAGFSPEHDVNGVTDPFLQAKLLRLLRVAAGYDQASSDAMNDVLAQVATNTESSKNVGNAILYETVLTIMNIQAESSLRVLAINILGKFLANKDNNIRYVALTTLTRISTPSPTNPNPSSSDASALQRHRTTILDCLKDPDISIRRRALDLSFQLVNVQNVRMLTRELLTFLEIAETDIKGSTASRICNVAAVYRPNRRWEVDTACRVLKVAGAHVDQDVINHFVKIATMAPADLQSYTVRKLYGILANDKDDREISQEGLVLATVWTIGEYGDVLVAGNSSVFAAEEDDDAEDSGASTASVSEGEVVDLIERILAGAFATELVKEYAVTALIKLSSRFSSSIEPRIRAVVGKYRSNSDVEVQQRAVEYAQLFSLDKATRDAVLEKMPVLEQAKVEEQRKGTGEPISVSAVVGVGPSIAARSAMEDLLGMDGDSMPVVSTGLGGPSNVDVLSDIFGSVSATAPPAAPPKPKDPLADLLGGISMGGGSAPLSKPAASGSGGTLDLLGDIFGAAPPMAAAPTSTISAAKPPALFGDLGGLGSLSGTSFPAAAPSPSMPSQKAPSLSGSPAMPSSTFASSPSMPSPAFATSSSSGPYTVFEQSGFKISIVASRNDHGDAVTLNTTFSNTSSQSLSSLNFQAAVPKALKLQMMPASSTSISPSGTATQMIRISNPSKAAIKLRLKISYSMDGVPVESVTDFAGFDSSLWA